ncbi:MAG: class I SAM-dependent methyltransferase [Burkholderiales bacterium]
MFSSSFTFHQRLSPQLRASLKSVVVKAIDILPIKWRLEVLAWRFGSDKETHGYIPHYAGHFARFRDRQINILEIGIGGYESHGGGESLRTWQRYFPRATVHGLDIFDKKRHEASRIRIYQGDQGDKEALRKLAKSIGPIHIIIDDGSHMNQHVHASFEALFPLLENGGVYVIEDMQTAYLKSMGGSSTDLSMPGTSMNLVKGLCDELNSMYIPNRAETPLSRWIDAIHVYRNIAFIEKRDNTGHFVSEAMREMMREEAAQAAA